MLLNVIMGSSASASSVLFSHWVAFWLTILLGGLNIYMVVKDHPRGIGPVLLTLFATPLIMLNPLVNLMMDKNIIADSSVAMSRLLNFITWVGVIEMTFATAWNSSLDHKVAKRCSCCSAQGGDAGKPSLSSAARKIRRSMLSQSASFDEI